MSKLPTGVESEGLSEGEGATMPRNPHEALEEALQGLREALSGLPRDHLWVGQAFDAVWEIEELLIEQRRREERRMAWEVQGVVVMLTGEVEAAPDEEADYFGLYYRGESDLAQWVADFATRRQAEAVANLLNLHGGRPTDD